MCESMKLPLILNISEDSGFGRNRDPEFGGNRLESNHVSLIPDVNILRFSLHSRKSESVNE